MRRFSEAQCDYCPLGVGGRVAAGTLHAWLRSGLGDWIGLVSYQVPFADGRHETLYLERQLVPAYALRPRKYGGR
jgi:hypothetical protein